MNTARYRPKDKSSEGRHGIVLRDKIFEVTRRPFHNEFKYSENRESFGCLQRNRRDDEQHDLP